MQKGTLIALGVLAAILLVVLGGIAGAVGAYNSFVRQSEAVDAQGHQVDVQYQLAFKVVPVLTNLTTQYMQNERAVMENVTALRSGLVPAQGGSFAQKDAYSSELQNFVLLVGNRAENYPDLKSSNLFQTSMNEVINTQNKIAMEKVRYNDQVQAYNAHRRECCLPVLVANMFGFGPKEYIGYKDRPNQDAFPTGTPL